MHLCQHRKLWQKKVTAKAGEMLRATLGFLDSFEELAKKLAQEIAMAANETLRATLDSLESFGDEGIFWCEDGVYCAWGLQPIEYVSSLVHSVAVGTNM